MLCLNQKDFSLIFNYKVNFNTVCIPEIENIFSSNESFFQMCGIKAECSRVAMDYKQKARLCRHQDAGYSVVLRRSPQVPGGTA